MTKDELHSKYENINLALISVEVYLEKKAEASAFLFGDVDPEYSPLIAIVAAARADVIHIIDELAAE